MIRSRVVSGGFLDRIEVFFTDAAAPPARSQAAQVGPVSGASAKEARRTTSEKDSPASPRRAQFFIGIGFEGDGLCCHGSKVRSTSR